LLEDPPENYESVAEGWALHPLYQRYFRILNDEMPVFLETKNEDEAGQVLEYHMGLASGAYSKMIQGFRPSFGSSYGI
jgi:hypothetical protein